METVGIHTGDRLSAIRQEELSTSAQPSARPSSPFPAEIVLDCLEALVSHVCQSDDFPSAYTSLANCAQVSKLWHAPAQKVLLSYVEVVRKEQAVSLFNTLQQQHKGDSVRNLVIGVGMTSPGQHLIDAELLYDILVTCPLIRKLVLIHHDLPGLRRDGDCDLPTVPDLPELTDVTIFPSGWKSSPDIELNFLRKLSTVRFLQLPCSEVNRTLPLDSDLTPPSFQLFGIAAQSITPVVEWALSKSNESLQCLTVAYMGDIEPVAQAYPNIRSLRILTRIATAPSSRLDAFEHLKRFEIRDLSASPSILRTLPPSTSYVRLWSTELARELCKMMEEGDQLGSLNTVVWDWYSPTGGSNDDTVLDGLMQVMDDLKSVCSQNGVEFRALERRDGRRASQGKDVAYESELRSSCFQRQGLLPVPLFPDDTAASTTKLPTRVFRDMHSLGLPLAAHFKSLSPFMDSTPGLWSPIFEDCLEGHGDWLERHLPALRAKALK